MLRSQSMQVSHSEKILTLPELTGPKAVIAFSTRAGGVSDAPLNSLNFSVSQGDSRENVRANCTILAEDLGIEPRRIVTCRQVHGDNVQVVDSIPVSLPVGDALITSTAGMYVGIKTADCLPILLLDQVHRVAAAVHAGWRGTVLRITRKVVRLMRDLFGTRPADIVAALGPAIGPCCYEVDDAVLIPFRQNIPNPERFITDRNHSGGEDSYSIDLAATNRFELTTEGVPPENIRTLELCTCCHPALFFSHRRDGAASGRHIALVGFRA
jgi:polyphenol oxidase